MDDPVVNQQGEILTSTAEVQANLFSVELQTLVITEQGRNIEIVHFSNIISFSCSCIQCGGDVPVRSVLESHKKAHHESKGNPRQSETGSALFFDKIAMDYDKGINSNHDGNGDFQSEGDVDDSAIEIGNHCNDESECQRSDGSEPSNTNGMRDEELLVHRSLAGSSSPSKSSIKKARSIDVFSLAERKERKRIKNANLSSRRVKIRGGGFSEGHLSQKPYGCIICGKRYLRGCDLGRHVKTHERNSAIDSVFKSCKNSRDTNASDAETIPASSGGRITESGNGNCKNDINIRDPANDDVGDVTDPLDSGIEARNADMRVDKLAPDTENCSSTVTCGPAKSSTKKISRYDVVSKSSSTTSPQRGREKRVPLTLAEKKEQKRIENAKRPSRRRKIEGRSFDEGHSSGKPYGCTVCGMRYPRGCELGAHAAIHKRDMPACHVCGKCFISSHTLRLHLLVHTGEKKHACNICGKTFRLKSQVDLHMVVHTGVKKYICAVCGAAFSWVNGLRAHSYIHKGKLCMCSLCGKSYTQPTSLRNHVKVVHEEKHYICTVCGKVLRSSSSFREHRNRHADEKPHLCSLCGRSFVVKYDLTRHLRTHTGDKPFSCSECGKKFNQKCYYEEHVRIHTGDKPYKCDQCGLAFRMRSAFRKHQQKEHEGTDPNEQEAINSPFGHLETSHIPEVHSAVLSLTGEVTNLKGEMLEDI